MIEPKNEIRTQHSFAAACAPFDMRCLCVCVCVCVTLVWCMEACDQQCTALRACVHLCVCLCA